MNDKAFEKKVNRDVNQAKKDLTTLRDDGVIALNRKLKPLAHDVKKTIDSTVKTLNNAVGNGLNQYNAKVNEVVTDIVPDGFVKKTPKFPWVAISLSLALGLLLGALLKPARNLLV
jgi:ElaB/YqjD/DUF883 family membrane-anchored ribosome-binding protein